MTYSPKTSSQVSLTDAESTTPIIPFGQNALILQAVQNLATVTFYGSVDGENFDIIKDASNASVTRSCAADTIHRIGDDLMGMPYIKLVSSTGGKGRYTVVHD